MIQTLLEQNCQNTEGLFRLPGNLKLVDGIADDANHGRHQVRRATVHDWASLLKKWFRDLPEPILPPDLAPKLAEAFEAKTFFEFLKLLPVAHLNTLKFLIGFLQFLVKNQAVTKMGPKNLAICFGPNIVVIKEAGDVARMQMFADIAIDFLVALIAEWDCSTLYPLPQTMLAPK
jgi:hypothetical protein